MNMWTMSSSLDIIIEKTHRSYRVSCVHDCLIVSIVCVWYDDEFSVVFVPSNSVGEIIRSDKRRNIRVRTIRYDVHSNLLFSQCIDRWFASIWWWSIAPKQMFHDGMRVICPMIHCFSRFLCEKSFTKLDERCHHVYLRRTPSQVVKSTRNFSWNLITVDTKMNYVLWLLQCMTLPVFCRYSFSGE
jgi:hypothetical protein